MFNCLGMVFDINCDNVDSNLKSVDLAGMQLEVLKLIQTSKQDFSLKINCKIFHCCTPFSKTYAGYES